MNLMARKIFVHDSVSKPASQRGVDRCFFNYTSALVKAFPDDVVVFSKRELNLTAIKQIRPCSYFLNSIPVIPKRISRRLDHFQSSLATLFFGSVYYSPYYGKVKTRIPQVFTAHDMIYEKFPHHFPAAADQKFLVEKRECFERAAVILCVSENTAKDIQYFYPNIPEDRLQVVYNGVSEFFRVEHPLQYRGKPYFLYVGNRSLYKNFYRMLVAFGRSGLSSDFDLRVISPLGDFPTPEENEVINKYHLEDNVHVEISVTEETLRKRYQQAFAFVFPSEYEGFGLPMLEAMACGTLVLAANNSSLPEIGGEIPLYFDPFSIDAILDTLIRASSISESERQQRIVKGKERSLLFTWDAAKEKFIKNIKNFL